VLAAPVAEYQSLIGALQQRALSPVLTSDAETLALQQQALQSQQPEAWLVFAAQPDVELVPVPPAEQASVEPVIRTPLYSAVFDSQSLLQMAEQQLVQQLPAKADLVLLSADTPWNGMLLQAEKRLAEQQLDLHSIELSQSDLPGQLHKIRGLDAVLVAGNLATESALRALKQVEKLQTTTVVAIGHSYDLLDAVHAGTLDGLIFLPPLALADATLASLEGEAVTPVAPVWVDKRNVLQVMQGTQG